MKAIALTPNLPVIVTEGPFNGHKGICIDPNAIPDKDDQGNDLPDRRKVEIELDDEGAILILPRQLEVDQEFLTQMRAEVQAAQSLSTAAVAQVAEVPSPVAPTSTQAPVVAFTGTTPHVATDITDPMDPALDCYRPNARVVKDYISRTMPGGYNDIDFLLHLREQRSEDGYSPNVALVGETQSGKTIFVEVLAVVAAERDGLPKPYPVFTIDGSSGVSNYDLYGKTTAITDRYGEERLVWMEGLVPLAAKCGAFLYLDEWNAVPPGQQVALHSLLDDRRRFSNTHKPIEDGHGGYRPEIIQADPKMWVISTINPQGYKGTQAQSEATSNRFRWLEWGYDDDVERELLSSDAVFDFGVLLRGAHRSNGGAMSTPVGTTALFRLNEDLANFGAEAALYTFLGLFQDRKDRIQVEEMIETQDIMDRLGAEFSSPTIAPPAKPSADWPTKPDVNGQPDWSKGAPS